MYTGSNTLRSRTTNPSIAITKTTITRFTCRAPLGVLAYATSTRNHMLVSIFLAIAGGGSGVRFMPNTLHGAGI